MRRAAVLLLVAGCSFATTHDVPKVVDPTRPPQCSTSRTAPIVDVTFAIVSGLTGLTLLSAAGIESATGGDNAGQLALYGLLTGVGGGIGFTWSAARGVDRASDCDELFKTYNSRMYGGGYQPPPPNLPPPGVDGGMCRNGPAPACDPGLVCASNGYCVPSAGPVPMPGSFRGECRVSAQPCDPGLTCVSNLCLPAVQ